MKLARLRLTNFRQHADTDIEFGTGLTGIIGPNGAGKSTILEAIAWALYGGNTARGGNESLRFNRAPARSPVRVELEFSLAGHRYRVVRGLSMAELYLDDGEVAIANSVTTVADMLQRRLGMTRTEFFNTYFTGQKELAVMQSLTASERGQFLSRVLGYEKLRVAQELCGARRKELGSEIAGLRAGMPDRDAFAVQEREVQATVTEAAAAALEAERVERETTEALESVAPSWLAAQTGRDERQRIETELAAVDGESLALTRSAERFQQELAEVHEARTALAPLLPDIEVFTQTQHAIESLRTLAVHDGRRRAVLEAQSALDGEVRALREQREGLAREVALATAATINLEESRRVHEETHGKLEARRTEWVRDRQEVETRLRALREQYAEFRDQRDKLLQLGEEGACPTCTRQLGEHFRTVLDVIERQLETVEADGVYFRSRMEQVTAMPADIAYLDELRKRLQEDVSHHERRHAQVLAAAQQLPRVERELASKDARLAAATTELAGIPGGYDADYHKALEAEHTRLAALSTLANRLTTRIEREPALLRERELLARQRSALDDRRMVAGTRLAALRFPEEEYQELRRLHDEVATAFAEAARVAAGARAMRLVAQGAAQRTAEARSAFEGLDARVVALDDDRRLHDELHRAYSDLRTDLNFQLRPEVSEIASNFLTELTDARYTELELDDKYRLIVLEEGVAKPVISGGEEDIANLVLRLAISQMIADRAGQAFSLLVLDEVFGSLDDVRRRNVLALLRGLHDRFEQVIVITHIDGVRDGLDRVISVGFDERTGAAIVSQVDPSPDESALLSAGTAA